MKIEIKNIKLYLILFLIFVFCIFLINKFEKKKTLISQSIAINLLTSVHPDLSWIFKPVKSKILIKPGDVTTVEYIVENLSDKTATGIATFAYFPREFGSYITKINCFCYGEQTLKPNEKEKFTLIILIDPEVTKDSKTNDVKEATIQFTFFDYKKYKENKS